MEHYSYIIVHKIASYGQVMNYAGVLNASLLPHEITMNRYKYTL